MYKYISLSLMLVASHSLYGMNTETILFVPTENVVIREKKILALEKKAVCLTAACACFAATNFTKIVLNSFGFDEKESSMSSTVNLGLLLGAQGFILASLYISNSADREEAAALQALKDKEARFEAFLNTSVARPQTVENP